MFIDFAFRDIFDSNKMCTFVVHTERAAKYMIDEFDMYCKLHEPYKLTHKTAKKCRQKISESKQFILILS